MCNCLVWYPQPIFNRIRPFKAGLLHGNNVLSAVSEMDSHSNHGRDLRKDFENLSGT